MKDALDSLCCAPQIFRIFDCDLHVLCESPEMREHIHRFTKNLADSTGASRPIVRLAIFKIPKGGSIFCCPEMGTSVTAHQEEYEWVNFRRILNTLLFSASTGYDLFHASCVTNDDGQTLVLSGDSGAGKTSLLIALLQSGFRMACDDLVPISRTDDHALAIPVGVSVDSDVIERFPELKSLQNDVCWFRSDNQSQWTLNLSDAFESTEAYASLKPTHFFFIESGFDSQSKIASCMQDEALWRLQLARKDALASKARMQAPNQMESFQLARRLTQKCRFFSMTNGCFQDTVALINRAVMELPSTMTEEALEF